MNEQQIFDQFRMWRRWTIEAAKGLPEEAVLKIPNHHRNNILWNIGHILVGWDNAIYQIIGEERRLPLQYHLMFPRGSFPSKWEEKPPEYPVLLEQLEAQTEELIEAAAGKLDQPLSEPFLHMTTLGEMFLFLTSHEALHLNVIGSLRRMVLSDV
ncbi:DinB family protein [Falsibacillus albus]|uniref:DinB family protein n=1 Tax=Falsibacillus albus TaxID=2478915 RepID=A0A3L7JRC7_9BACI|nr:DinB family protein [Falsibacillus albus]RLQ93216.1 DinB family protein [Falsibacillus albus]